MHPFTRFLFLVAIAIAALVIQEFRLCAIAGVTPNLLLVLFSVLIVQRERPLVLGMLGCALVAIVLVFVPFWLVSFGLLIVIVALLFFFARILTGSNFADVFILVAGGTVLFSIINSLSASVPFPWFGTGIELILNLLATGIVAFVALRDLPVAR